MFDCVYPTRTARFGSALVRNHPGGILQLKSSAHKMDFRPIEEGCECSTCKVIFLICIIFLDIIGLHIHFDNFQAGITRSYIQSLLSTKQTTACHLISVHNVWYQLKLMSDIRESIKEDRFPQFVKEFFEQTYVDKVEYPQWAVEALKAVNIDLLS